jgi:hypothetical protein
MLVLKSHHSVGPLPRQLLGLRSRLDRHRGLHMEEAPEAQEGSWHVDTQQTLSSNGEADTGGDTARAQGWAWLDPALAPWRWASSYM